MSKTSQIRMRGLGSADRRRSLAVRLKWSEHDVRSCEQLGDGGRGVGETLRIDHGGLWWPDDADHGRHAVRFDQFDCESIMVDLACGEGCGGMLGQGGAPFRLGPGPVLATPLGAALSRL